MDQLSPETRRAWLQAADAGDVEELRRLLAAHPALLNCSDRHEQSLKCSTALHLCAWRNHAESAAFLLQNGADLEARDEGGFTPLQIDILRVCMEKMRPIPLLRSHCIDIASPVALARYRRQLVRDRSSYDQIDTSTLEVLLKYKADVNSYTEVGEMALLLALDDGLIKHVKLLLAHGADVYSTDKSGRSTLDIAAEHGYADLVELLIKRNPDLIRLTGERALRAAVCHDSESVVDLLYEPVMQLTSDLNERRHVSGKLFHLAIEYDAKQVTLALLRKGVPVDSENDDGETALHVACKSFECDSILDLLLEHNADGNRCSPTTGYSPYHLAVQHHCPHAIATLANHGANINLFDRNSHTPLVYAAVNGYSVETMDTLIQHGAHFRFREMRGRDAVAELLTSWVYNLAPSDVPALIDTLVVAGCAEHERSRCVVTALLWSKHTKDALLFLFLVLFTAPTRASETARTIISEWLQLRGATPVALKLLDDVLKR